MLTTGSLRSMSTAEHVTPADGSSPPETLRTCGSSTAASRLHKPIPQPPFAHLAGAASPPEPFRPRDAGSASDRREAAVPHGLPDRAIGVCGPRSTTSCPGKPRTRSSPRSSGPTSPPYNRRLHRPPRVPNVDRPGRSFVKRRDGLSRAPRSRGTLTLGHGYTARCTKQHAEDVFVVAGDHGELHVRRKPSGR